MGKPNFRYNTVQHFKNSGQEWGFGFTKLEVRLNLERLNANIENAQAWLGEQVLQSSRAYMPFRSGSLSQRSHTEEGGKKVVFPGPYSRFLYMGKLMVGEESRSPWAKKGEKKVVTNTDLKYTRTFNPKATSFWFEEAKKTDLDAWVSGVRERVTKR